MLIHCVVCAALALNGRVAELHMKTWRPRDRMAWTIENIYYLAPYRKSSPIPALENPWN